MPFGLLTKQKDTRFNGEHPNRINEGYVFKGYFEDWPSIGQRFTMSSPSRWFSTSRVVEILYASGHEVRFKTENSIYHVKIFHASEKI